MAHLSLDQLTTYRLVIGRGSFTAAAEALGISQPAVSLQMRQLETALQTRLIERTGRGVRPTPAGLTLLAHCEEIEKAVSAAVQSVAMHKLDISGTVTLGTGATVCIHLLPALLQQLRKDYPQLSVGVRTGNTQDIVRGVEENSIDIGLVTLPAISRNLDVTPVMVDEFVTITAKPTLAESEVETEELPLIVFASGSSTRQLIDGWFQRAGKNVSPVMELGSIEAIKRMVRAGLGYSIVPRMSVTQAEDCAGLTVEPLVPALHRTLGLIMRQDKVVSRAMREVIHRIQAIPAAKSKDSV
ncbi:HTH-type transcriptional activator CmpR [Phytobacter ursingii]|nr:HTH-type transcriptional activator CmpR [Phytobacter ursingii]